MSAPRAAKYKLQLIKEIIADYYKNIDITITESIQKNIANAEDVAEIWCELFSNALYDLFDYVKNEMAEAGIFPTAKEMHTLRKSDHTIPLLWLAASERGSKELNFEYFKTDDLTNLNTCVDKDNENFFHKLSQSDAGLKFFELYIYYKKNLNSAALNQVSKKDNTCAWHRLLYMLGELVLDYATPSTEAMLTRARPSDLNVWEVNLLVNTNDTTLQKLIDKKVLPKTEDISWRRVIENSKNDERLAILIAAGVAPSSGSLRRNYPGQIKNAWDTLIVKEYYQVINALFANKIYPDVEQLIKIRAILYMPVWCKSYRALCVRNHIENKLKADKTELSMVKVITTNHIFQNRYQFREHNLVTELLSSHDDTRFYGLMHALYLMIKPNGTSNYYAPEILLKILSYLLPQRFIQEADRLLTDPSNRSSFFKWHMTKNLEEKCNINSDDPLIKEFHAANDSQTWVKNKYWDLKFTYTPKKNFFNLFNTNQHEELLNVFEDGTRLTQLMSVLK